VLASTMIDELTQRRSKCILYFFCDYKNMSKNTLHMLLRTFTSQFLVQNLDMLPFSNQWMCASSQTSASLAVLRKHFKELLQSCTEPIYLILDGLDECVDEQQSSIQAYLHQVICEIDKGNSKLLRLCIISRPIQLHTNFQRLIRLKINIGQTGNGADIRRYVVAELHRVKDDLEPYIPLTTTWIKGTTGKLVDRADGTYSEPCYTCPCRFKLYSFHHHTLVIKMPSLTCYVVCSHVSLGPTRNRMHPPGYNTRRSRRRN